MMYKAATDLLFSSCLYIRRNCVRLCYASPGTLVLHAHTKSNLQTFYDSSGARKWVKLSPHPYLDNWQQRLPRPMLHTSPHHTNLICTIIK